MNSNVFVTLIIDFLKESNDFWAWGLARGWLLTIPWLRSLGWDPLAFLAGLRKFGQVLKSMVSCPWPRTIEILSQTCWNQWFQGQGTESLKSYHKPTKIIDFRDRAHNHWNPITKLPKSLISGPVARTIVFSYEMIGFACDDKKHKSVNITKINENPASGESWVCEHNAW